MIKVDEFNQNDQVIGSEAPSDGSDGKEQLARGLSCLYSPDDTAQSHIRDVADVLVEMNKISDEQVQQIRRQKDTNPDSTVEQLITKAGIASIDDILMARAGLSGLTFFHITSTEINRDAFNKLDLDYIRSSRIMPVAVEDGVLIVVTSETDNVFALDDVKRRTEMSLKVVVCSDGDIEAVCNEFDESKLDYSVNEMISDMADVEVVSDNEEEIEDLEKSAGESPVIKFVNYLLSNAVHNDASDIHIEPKKDSVKIRYRIDGVLFNSMEAPLKMHPAVVSRLKIMANLDISERRLPQDGKISVIMGGWGIDLRVSILPTSHGEKVVIRILDSRSVTVGLNDAGMEHDVLSKFREQIGLPHGILLVTGPTGSGKSTTLYSALSELDGEKLNISTVEDPVEYDLDFCNQVQVRTQIGLTFESALRSLLRQDPDVIMVGEIRDKETAHIAVQAALTGHLVFSTLHTNDASSSISRLVDIGIEPYLIAGSLNGVLAQRLVRKICPDCKESYQASENLQRYIEMAGINQDGRACGRGCEKCRESGYLGRSGIFELLVVDEKVREVINKNPSVDGMRQVFAESGHASLFVDGMKKVERGITTIDEVLRVTEVYNNKE